MKLKICGMKYTENILEVAKLQPDYLGFIFYDQSSRFFDATIPNLPKSIKKVGVFVNASITNILDMVKKHQLQAVQLHGDESPEFCIKLNECLVEHSQDLNKTQIIKVFSLSDNFNFEILQPFESVCDYFLFDTKGKLPGGNGYTFDWEILKKYPSTKPYFLSGGIGIEESEKLKSFFETSASNYCYAIDVNSKFEIKPGLKDTEALQMFKYQLNKIILT